MQHALSGGQTIGRINIGSKPSSKGEVHEDAIMLHSDALLRPPCLPALCMMLHFLMTSLTPGWAP